MKSFSLRSSASVGVSFLLLVLITILSLNCRKFDLGASEKTKKDNPFNVKNAKEWWFGEFKKSTAYRQINENSPLFVKLDNNTVNKIPSWKRAVEYKIGKWDIVETPLFYSEQKVLLPSMQALNYEERLKVANSTITRMLLIKLPNDSVVVRTMTVVPTLQYASKINYDISGFRFNKFLKDFDGYIFISDWSGKSINSFNIRKGNVGKKLKFVKNENIAHKSTEVSNTIMSSGGMCLEWVPNMVRGCIGIPDGDEPPELDCEEWREDGGSYEFVECEGGEGDLHGDCYTNGGTPEECACMMMGIGCEGGGGNGEGEPNSEGNGENDINNDITDPCIRYNVEQILSRDCKNELTKFVNEIFDNNKEFDLVLTSLPFANNSSMAAYTVTEVPLIDVLRTSIKFNTNVLSGATQEYITTVIFHEFTHAWINHFYTSPHTNAEQHNMMTNSPRFSALVEALLEMFGGPNGTLSYQDAVDLAWGGNTDSIAFNNLPSTERNRILQRIQDFKTGVSGTPCQ